MKKAAPTKRPRSSDVSYWLLKSEPDKFSIEDLKKMKVSPWDGVRNAAARNHMKAMKLSDKVFFYHSNCKEPGIVGIAEVVREFYDDHTALDKNSEYYYPKATKENNPWKMVDVSFVAAFEKIVSLKQMKEDKHLRNMVLFKQSRLSVQPVAPEEYDHILSLAKQI
ncbi:thymocyte nuclear protein 1 [Strigomonas culicis]|uniref:Thymocyte nuclear protein 1 n=1 Tax=Strigomonas culicis TaxID=28005 RepID=S9UZV2_9TRYP|nr:thymocyte nuclear protein 1 [Strigomonas culicis]|eukprot:EPY36397.1 thymocyte nuclear protein 1 [Strigomonas culicis]